MVKCIKCGGEIDKDTHTCKSCGYVYSSEEMEKLLMSDNVKQWLSDNVSADQVEEKDVLQKWLLGDDQSLEKLISEIDSGLRELTEEEIKSIDTNISSRLKELAFKQKEFEEREHKIIELEKQLQNLLDKFKKENASINDIYNENIALLKENNELKYLLSKQNKKIYDYDSFMSEIGKLLDVDPSKVGGVYIFKKRIKDIIYQKESLVYTLNSKENELELIKGQLENALNTLPKDLKALEKKELELNQLKISLDNLKNELTLREQQLKQESFLMKENEEIGNIEDLKAELEKKNAEIDRYRSELKFRDELLSSSSKKIDITYLSEKMGEEIQKYRLEIEDLKTALALKEKESEKLSERLKYKDEEISRRETDLNYREKKLQEQLKQYEMDKIEISNFRELQKQHNLENLNEAIKLKEEELRTKTKYLEAKEREIELKEKGLIQKEIDNSKEEVALEIKQEKVKTGTRRLDDLLFGGFPIGSNVIVYGPAYSGKEVLIYSFIAEGLKKGVISIILLLDKTLEEVMQDMKFVLPEIEEYRTKGLLYIIDAYSRSIGDKTVVEGVEYISSQTDVNSIMNSIDEIVQKNKSSEKYYRLAVLSLSTLLTFMDNQQLLKFLQPFTTKRKRDKGVSMYMMEKGIHSENEVQMISYLMDGIIEFKTEGSKTLLMVKGVSEVQSRSWIEVTPSKTGLIMGSFTLGHIK
ncbi:MAG: ATPase domain-containing protein [Thermoplasmata archaeon]